MTISVSNVNEVGAGVTSADAGTALENQNQLYTAAATDAVNFTNGVVSYSLKAGGDAGLLNIDANTGLVTLKTGNLDAEGGKTSYTFAVEARDATGNVREQSVTVNVGNLNDNPVLLRATSTRP